VLYIDVTKVDRNVAHVLMAIHVCFKCMFQMFHLFQMYVASVLSRCCKNISECCIYMHVASICFKCFRCFMRMLQVFHLDVAYVCNGFQVFLDIFASVSDVCFKCSICLLLYVATVAYRCFKSRSGVAHEMRVGSGWWCGPATRALTHSLCRHRLDASARPGASKSVYEIIMCPVMEYITYIWPVLSL
jgi:hypothetical protein